MLLLLGAISLAFVFGCRKDHFDAISDTSKQFYPISVTEAKRQFNLELQNPRSFTSNPFIQLLPIWDSARVSGTLSGKEVVVVPIADSTLLHLNDNRMDAKLVFDKVGPDSIKAQILVYVADSAYYHGLSGNMTVQNFTGLVMYYDISQNFEYGISVRNGEAIGKVDSIYQQYDPNNTYDRAWCIKQTTITKPCPRHFTQSNSDELCVIKETIITMEECAGSVGSGSGGTGGGNTGGGSTGGGNNGNGSSGSGGGGGNEGNYNKEKDFWANLWGGFPLSAFKDSEIPPGFTRTLIDQLMQINNELTTGKLSPSQLNYLQNSLTGPQAIAAIRTFFTEKGTSVPNQTHMKAVLNFLITNPVLLNQSEISILLNNKTFFNTIKELTTTLTLHSAHVAWLINNQSEVATLNTFISTHSQTTNQQNVAYAVAVNYIAMLSSNDAELIEMMNDIKTSNVGDPVWDILLELLGDVVEEALIDVIPGGTTVQMGPVAIQQFKNGEWLNGLWTVINTALDEGGKFLGPTKFFLMGITLADKAKLIKKVYKACKEAKQLGEEFVAKLYTVVKNRVGLSEIKNKFIWLGGPNGAKLDGEKSSDVFEDFKNIFGASMCAFNDGWGRPIWKVINQIPNTNSAVYMINYPDSSTGWNFTIAFYRGPTNATSFAQLDAIYKIRFDQ